MLRILIVVVAITLGAFTTTANAETGNELLQSCENKSSFEAGYCLGTVAGSYDALLVARAAIPGLFCPPSKGITNGQVQQIVTDFLEDKPSLRHLDATTLIIGAVSEAWPCPSGKITVHPTGGFTVPKQQ